MAKRRVGSRTAKKRATRTAKRPPKSRARRAIQSADDQSGWPYSRFAVWSQRWGSPNDDNQTHPTTVLLRHPTTPFMGTASTSNFENDLKRIAHSYLLAASNSQLVNPALALPPHWLDALDPAAAEDPWFGWLPLGWPSTNEKFNSLVSFAAERTNASDDGSDLMVIMQASQPTGSGYGVRVVAHVRKPPTQPRSRSPASFEIRISGMSAFLPIGRWLPRPAPRAARTRQADAAQALAPSAFIDLLTNIDFKTAIASAINLEDSSLAIQGMRLLPPTSFDQPFPVELTVTGQDKRTDGSRRGLVNLDPYYSYVLAFQFTHNAQGLSSGPPLKVVSKTELVADAGTTGTSQARVFPIDPASQLAAKDLRKRRPTRDEIVLDQFRTPEPIPQYPKPLDYAPDGYNDDEVVVCPGFVVDDDGQTPDTPKEVDLTGGGPPVRSDDASAVMAYWNVKQFFDRLRAYGLSPANYFRCAPLPVEVHYRSGIRPGPGKDGQTVNARVRVKGFPPNFEGTLPPGSTHPIEIHMALADLSTRARKLWDGKVRSPAEPLGIAADARWIWHEMGHVLLTASIGDLQFRFAHSPGDALAAIVSDPESELATDANWRGATFPWVFLPRRHDRCVALGWSWGGALHYDLSQVPDSAGPRQKAYWSEQILSSSLFRLYRCIGGDTAAVGSPNDPDPHARRSASHYCVYLIMRAIQILGNVVPANDPDQFVSALIEADVDTASNSVWHVVFPPVFPVPTAGQTDTFDRIGGCVHKVIRWAFEAQGLYRRFTSAPGYPPPVDIFIADLRPASESMPGGVINYGPGTYNPVSLEWDPSQDPQNPLTRPKWQADPTALQVSTNGQISVVVGNRGTASAANVEVSVWWQEWPVPQGPGPHPAPQWDSTSWAQCAPTGPATPQTILASGHATFGPFAAVPLPAGRRYLLLAQATCPDDRANTDPATNLPCSQKTTPLVDLVANDNNLGLRVLRR